MVFVYFSLIRRQPCAWFWKLRSEKKSALSSWNCSTRWKKTTGEAADAAAHLPSTGMSFFNTTLLCDRERLEKEREILEERAEKRVEILKNLVSKTVDLTTPNNGCTVRKTNTPQLFLQDFVGMKVSDHQGKF